MKIYVAHEHYDKGHLAKVKNQMEKLGAPTIKVVAVNSGVGVEEYAALEGCHRIRAAQALGLNPDLIVYDLDEIAEIELDEMGLDFDNPGMTVLELVEGCFNRWFYDTEA